MIIIIIINCCDDNLPLLVHSQILAADNSDTALYYRLINYHGELGSCEHQLQSHVIIIYTYNVSGYVRLPAIWSER